jgi:predicted MPP superfamily phosphohydrolase
LKEFYIFMPVLNHKIRSMFHLYITLAFIIPNIYVFFRIRYLFISKGYRLWYSLMYLLMAITYPISEMFPQGEMNLFMQLLSVVSGYILPFFLYLFLSVLLFDLFLLLNILIRVVPSGIRKSFSFRFYTFSTMVILSVTMVVAGAINLNTIRVSEYQVVVPRRNSTIDHLRVAFIADFHIRQNTSLSFVKQFVNKINALQPDLMLYGGDMTEGDSENETSEAVESALRSINPKYGVFGVTGNHEFYGGRGQGSFFRKAGITLLCDTMVKINGSFYLAGRYDQHIRQRKTLNGIIGSDFPDLPVILMDHRPTELREVSLTPVDVQFSGHTHDGQMFPINLITNSIYELSWGYKKIRNTHFFVTSGLRLWGPPVKTAGKSEIMLVDIRFE